MKIINPKYKLSDENNVFYIREKEYSSLLDKIKLIVQPVTEVGFEIKELDLVTARLPSTAEMSKSLKKEIVIKLKKGEYEIDLSMFIPKLVEHNYFVINGRKKIPLFQLFDIPVITRGGVIKIRTNVANISITVDRKDNNEVKVIFLKRRFPLALLLLAYYGPTRICNMFSLNGVDAEALKDNRDTLEKKLLYDLKLYYSENSGETQDYFIKLVGEYFSKTNYVSEGNKVLYALDLLLKVDIFSAKYFSKHILEEIIDLVKGKTYNDLDYKNKRLRCFEYVILSTVCKTIFDFCLSNREHKQPSFNINSTNIISSCNVSDIVQFDFSINPIDELTMLTRTSLTGPDGFKKDNVPPYLRDVTDSMFGKLCTVDTPDRENCGILQNIAINCKLDDELNFADSDNTIPLSIPVSMVPFLKNDDTTRLQMASSQSRQAILLDKFDKPMIMSGCEGLYTEYTQFVRKARKDGEVVYLGDEFLIIVYKDKDYDVFKIKPRKIFVENVDLYTVYVKEGDKVKAGDIVAESRFCKDGDITLGRNLLTAVVPYYGRNYEDAILISKNCKDLFSSVHYVDLSFNIPPNAVLLSLLPSDETYKPLPYIGDVLGEFSHYAILKKFPAKDGRMENDIIFHDEKYLTTENKDVKIIEIELYANEWYEDIPQYKNWIEGFIAYQQNKEKEVQDIITKYLPKDNAKEFIKDHSLEQFSKTGKYRNKGEKLQGIHVKMTGIYTRPLNVGDKLSNRHGNKGVISTIVSNEKMLKLEDGRTVDICISPMSSLSRMNMGQIYELHLSMSLNDLKNKILSMLNDNVDNNDIKEYLLKYIDIVDKTENKWYSEQFVAQLPEAIDKKFIEELTLIQPPFESMSSDDIKLAMEYTNTKYRYNIFEPLKNINIHNEIAVGYIYFSKLVHMSENKITQRGFGTYSKKTMQPLGGRKNLGGQRAGEMEIACIIAQDAPKNLEEFLTLKSDCIDLKNKYIEDVYGLNRKSSECDIDDMDVIPESVKVFTSYLKVMGIEV